MDTASQPSADQVLASAARFLIDGHDEIPARVLLACSLSYDGGEDDFGAPYWNVTLTGPRFAFDVLEEGSNPMGQKVRRAVEAVLPAAGWTNFTVRAQLVQLDPAWRTELLEIARGERIDNQAARAKDAVTWANLRFRSVTETRVAQALDRRRVLFLPNCMADSISDRPEEIESQTSSCVTRASGASSRSMATPSTRLRERRRTMSVIDYS